MATGYILEEQYFIALRTFLMKLMDAGRRQKWNSEIPSFLTLCFQAFASLTRFTLATLLVTFCMHGFHTKKENVSQVCYFEVHAIWNCHSSSLCEHILTLMAKYDCEVRTHSLWGSNTGAHILVQKVAWSRFCALWVALGDPETLVPGSLGDF